MTLEDAPFLFVGNGQYANRGCEAIAKSSIRLIREYYPNAPIVNGNELGDYDQIDETEPDVRHIRCSCMGAAHRKMRISKLIFDKTRLMVDISQAGRTIREWAPHSRAVLSMGGDLYGLSQGSITLLQYVFLGRAAIRAGKPFIIWGATIGNMDAYPVIKRTALNHFRECSLILVRDKASLEYLENNGVKDNVKLVADPAFLLKPVEPTIPLPNNDPLEEMIGLNLASSYGSQGGLGSYRDMIRIGADCVQGIMKTTGKSVLLIPHIVAYPDNTTANDTIFLSLVRECLAERGIDVPLLPSSLRVWEIKWVLGKLKAYVGSRFHSTVGALGSGTPTISICFSEKAPALNQLLLGHTRFVMHCRNLTPTTLSEMTCQLLSEEDAVRKQLQKTLPEIQALAHSAGDYLKEALSK